MRPSRKSLEDEAFRHYVAGAMGSLGRLATLLCGDRHLAEDLVQSCLSRVYRVWPRIRDSDSVDTYVRKVLLRCWLTERKRAWRRAERRDGEVPERPDYAADPAAAAETSERLRILRRALAEVPPRQRAAIVLRYWSQLSVAETAAVLRCSEGTVKSQTARGIATLRAVMARQGDSPALIWELNS